MRKVLLNMVFVLSLVLVMTTSSVFASVEGELFTEDINVIEEIKDVQDIYDVDQIYDMDNFYEINKVEDLDINYDMELMAVDRDLWDQNYNNVGSVKKNISATNYAYPYDIGTVNVFIENTGNTAIEVNIYKSWWNTETIDYDTIQSGSSRVFTVGPEHGITDCHTNNCFGKHDFTVSVYSVQGPVSFYGRARIYY